MSDLQSAVIKLRTALSQEREAVLANFTKVVKARLIKHAQTNGASACIEQYTKSRRQLGYLNRLPQELGRYADSLEGGLRAKQFLVGQAATLPMQQVEEWFYAWIDKAEKKGISAWYVAKTSNFNYLVQMLADHYQQILFKNTVPAMATAWIKAVHRLLRSQTRSAFTRLLTQIFNPARIQLEQVAHIRGLATILKSEEFQDAVKKQLKAECLTAIAEIERKVLGQDHHLVGIVVVPDVEEADRFVGDFISDTGVMRNVVELAGRFPELKELSERVGATLEKIKHEIDVLETKNG